ncbi:unnamed protein product [Prorocentrum cordatum]|uniref:Uncharacterized protein n=1 Tax=Prorocentrum cordatum TaxID=2364126 RepID=A0ABN9WKT9_9DINO|nr:unnamed protein product [Polarella glacialis]
MATVPTGAAARKFWRRLRPGDLYPAWFEDDMVWHERMCLWPTAEAGTWLILTPDGHVSAESVVGSLEGPAQTRAMRGGVVPAAVRESVYRFKEHPGSMELRTLVSEAHEEALLDSRGVPMPPVEVYVSPSGRGRPVEALLGDSAVVARRPLARRGPFSTSVGWERVGDVGEAGDGDVLLGAEGFHEALATDGGGWTNVLAMSAQEREAFRERARRPAAPAPAAGGAVGEAEAAAGVATPRADDGLDAPAARLGGERPASGACGVEPPACEDFR